MLVQELVGLLIRATCAEAVKRTDDARSGPLPGLMTVTSEVIYWFRRHHTAPFGLARASVHGELRKRRALPRGGVRHHRPRRLT